MQTILDEACQKDDYKLGVVLGPQVTVNGEPYMKQVMKMCELQLDFVNPSVVFEGEKQGVCVDTFHGNTKHSRRNFPVVVQSQNNHTVTLLHLEQVCMFMNAYDLMHAQW